MREKEERERALSLLSMPTCLPSLRSGTRVREFGFRVCMCVCMCVCTCVCMCVRGCD